MPKKYPEKLAALLRIISRLDNREEHINLLIDYAEKFSEVPPEIAVRPFPKTQRVEYCESEVFVWTESLGGSRFKFHFAVENPHGISAKALAAIVCETLSGEEGQMIMKLDTSLIHEIFGENLSMGKNLGLIGMLLLMKKQVGEIMGKQM